MARLKFLVFALVAVGLWGYHLTVIAPLAVTSSHEQAQSAVAGAVGPVAVALESQRSLTQAVALKVATTGPALWNAGPKAGAKPEAPTVDRFASVRAAATEALPAELKEQLFVAVTNEVGLLAAKGSGEPAATAPEGLELAAVTQAGGAGVVRSVDGVSYLLFAAPLAISDKNEVRQAGAVIVGLPVLPDGKLLEQAQKSLGLAGLALVAEGKPVLLSGDKASLDAVLAKVKVGSISATSSGAVRELGPLALPIMVDTVQSLGSRQAIAGTPFEVAAVASSRAALDALAAYQVFALGGLAGLLLLTIVFTIIMGGGHEEGPAMVLPPPMPLPPRREDGSSTGLKPAFTPEPEPEPAAPPEASPDDFHFPASTNSAPPPPPPPQSSPSSFAISSPSAVTGASPIFTPEPQVDPFAASAPPPPPPPARPPPPIATSEAPAFQPARGLMDDDEGQRTVAYPAFKPPPGAAPPVSAPPISDPFALAAAQQGDEGTPMGEDNPDATRVAAVPAELIKAARAGASGNTGERPALKAAGALPKVAAVAPAVGGAADEERHFQEVFRDFVATREKCREPSDGLTYDKFKAKLLKNKEQLVAKYQCRTVRFQVYVKDGKAALKATPVKE